MQYLHCSNANTSQSRSIDIYNQHGSIEGGRCFNVAWGAKRSQGQFGRKKKSNVGPLVQYWLNFSCLQQACLPGPGQTNVFSHSTSLFDCQPLLATVTSATHEVREKETGRQGGHDGFLYVTNLKEIIFLLWDLLNTKLPSRRHLRESWS